MTETISEKLAAIKARLNDKLTTYHIMRDPETGTSAVVPNNASINAGAISLERNTVSEIIERLETLEVENARLREAIEPFAQECADWDQPEAWADDCQNIGIQTSLIVQHLRLARAALEGK